MPPPLGVINKAALLLAAARRCQAYTTARACFASRWSSARRPPACFARARGHAECCAAGRFTRSVRRFDAPVSFAGDLVLFAHLLALARFFTTAAASIRALLEGMEPLARCRSRVSRKRRCSRPSSLVRASGSLSLTPMLHAPAIGGLRGLPGGVVLVAVGLFVALFRELARSGRRSQYSPRTHDDPRGWCSASGPLLGLVFYGAAVKLSCCRLLLHLVLPVHTGNAVLDWLLFATGIGDRRRNRSGGVRTHGSDSSMFHRC